MRAEHWDADPAGAVPRPRNAPANPREHDGRARGPASGGASRPSAPTRDRSGAPSARADQRTRPERGRSAASTGRLRGSVAVAGMFLVTLLAAAAESLIGQGLGTATLVALALTGAVAALKVRRSDLLTVVVSPPLVFVAVAVVDIVLAPSVDLKLGSLATLLIRGFPAMGVATVVVLLCAIVRWVRKR